MSDNGLIAAKQRWSDFLGRMYRLTCGKTKSNLGSASLRFCDAGTSCRDPRCSAQIVDCFA